MIILPLSDCSSFMHIRVYVYRLTHCGVHAAYTNIYTRSDIHHYNAQCSCVLLWPCVMSLCVCVCGIGAHNNRLSQFPRNLESGRQGCRATVVIPGAPRTSTNGHCYVYVVYFFGVVQRNLATFCTFIHPICECTFSRWAIVPAGERHSGAIYTRIQGKIWNTKEEEDKKKIWNKIILERIYIS